MTRWGNDRDAAGKRSCRTGRIAPLCCTLKTRSTAPTGLVTKNSGADYQVPEFTGEVTWPFGVPLDWVILCDLLLAV